jgi:hypothetical protein
MSDDGWGRGRREVGLFADQGDLQIGSESPLPLGDNSGEGGFSCRNNCSSWFNGVEGDKLAITESNCS